ncbi:MAG: AAA family ATPase, partial [Acetatifactor sp.]|nr:AAA family ATPase [Acetatifactor sp.]
CRHYLEIFSLDVDKRLMELSEGMKVKFNLTLALSHRAEFLILDEPTSGLDPVSREELLEIFLDLAAQGVSILFSTHITSDLDKCADAITYIQRGQIIASQRVGDFVERYRLAVVPGELTPAQRELTLGIRRSKEGQTALILKGQESRFEETAPADLETVMVHLEAGADKKQI